MVLGTQRVGSARPHLLERLQRPVEAGAACDRATALCQDPAVRAFLQRTLHLPLVRCGPEPVP